ncbi:MAG: hypothetical protein IMZ57_11085 [Acidobacteria bacterium]|nr:hypothetical protein [Acidobacteriota bacterium]
MRKEKSPIWIPHDRARWARSLKAAAVAVVNRAYLELVSPGRATRFSHDEALAEIAGVAGVTKNGVRNWLSNTNRPGRRSAEAIILAYDRDLSARYGLLPLDRPVEDHAPKKDKATTAKGLGCLIFEWLTDLRLHIDDRILVILNELFEVKGYAMPYCRDQRPVKVSIQKREDGFWLSLESETGKSGAIHIETGLPLLRELLARAADPGPQSIDDRSLSILVRKEQEELRKSFGLQAGATDPGIPEPVPAELASSFVPDGRTVQIYQEEKENPVGEIPLHGPAGPPPANGSDRSEPGLAEENRSSISLDEFEF